MTTPPLAPTTAPARRGSGSHAHRPIHRAELRASYRTALVAALSVLVAAFVTPTSTAAGSPATQARTTTAPNASTPAPSAVLAVSVAGLKPSAIRRLGASRTPNIHRLIRDGASTLNARTTVERTRSLPNQTGVLTGRRVDVARRGHGIKFDEIRPATTVHSAAGHYVSSVFDVVHDRGGSTAMYVSERKLSLFERTWADHGAPDRVGGDEGTNKLCAFKRDSDEDALVAAVRRDLADGPATFTFLQLAGPDRAGRRRGYGSRHYLAAVARADRRVGTILSDIGADPDLSGLAVVLTADHGGRKHDSSDPRRRANFTVPFLVWGAGVARGTNLYKLNPDYANPGAGRPGYGASRPPVRNADLGNVATDLLGLPAIPGSRANSKHDLDVAPASDSGPTDPGTTDPGTTEPGPTDPGTTDPGPGPSPTGFPDASTTGTTGPLTRHNGNMSVTRDGAVIKDLDIRGELRVTGDNVRIQNVRVQTDSFWVVLVQSQGVVIEDSTFIGGDNSQAALAGEFVARRLDLSGAGDGIKMHNGGELHDSFIHDLSDAEGAHNDGIEASGGRLRLIHNSVLNPRSQTSAIMLTSYGSNPDTDVLIKNNLLGGAGYTFYGGAPDTARGHEVIGNRFTTRYFADSGYYGPVAYWRSAGNTWSDNRWIDGPNKGQLITP